VQISPGIQRGYVFRRCVLAALRIGIFHLALIDFFDAGIASFFFITLIAP
jgi:hypothetical protein